MKELITIIVPIYNAQRYLSKCIRSLSIQTYRNIEILLIDDGSTDQSLKICNKYARADERIKVVKQSNGGVSKARNLGLSIMKGEYVTFLDSDDFLPKDAIETLYKEMVVRRADCCVGSIKRIDLYRTTQNKNIKGEIALNNSECLAQFIFDREKYDEPGFIAGKFYKSEIIQSHSLRFIEGMKLGEDGEFFFNYLKHCGKIAVLDKCVYNYNRLYIGGGGKYYEEINQWNALSMQARFNLFDFTKLSEEGLQLVKVGFLASFRWTLSKYINSNIEYKKCIQKIEESFILYRKLYFSHFRAEDFSDGIWLACEKEEYTNVYKILRFQRSGRLKNLLKKLKNLMENIYRGIRFFLIYKKL